MIKIRHDGGSSNSSLSPAGIGRIRCTWPVVGFLVRRRDGNEGEREVVVRVILLHTFPVSPGAGCKVTDAGEHAGS